MWFKGTNICYNCCKYIFRVVCNINYKIKVKSRNWDLNLLRALFLFKNLIRYIKKQCFITNLCTQMWVCVWVFVRVCVNERGRERYCVWVFVHVWIKERMCEHACVSVSVKEHDIIFRKKVFILFVKLFLSQQTFFIFLPGEKKRK